MFSLCYLCLCGTLLALLTLKQDVSKIFITNSVEFYRISLGKSRGILLCSKDICMLILVKWSSFGFIGSQAIFYCEIDSSALKSVPRKFCLILISTFTIIIRLVIMVFHPKSLQTFPGLSWRHRKTQLNAKILQITKRLQDPLTWQ